MTLMSLSGVGLKVRSEGATVLSQNILKATSPYILEESSLKKNYEPSLIAQTETQSRTALVIGNANYEEDPLDNPINDAKAIYDKLKSLGFDVMPLLLNGNEREMDKALNEFKEHLDKGGGVGVFYYAGHGVQIEGENYLLPVGEYLESEEDVIYKAFPLNKAITSMQNSRTSTNILIVDACRNNPYYRKWRSTRGSNIQGLAKTLLDSRGTLIAYASEPGKAAEDGKGKHSPFTESLIKHIDTPNLNIESMLKRVAKDVLKSTQNIQFPWDEGKIIGDFSFNPSNIPLESPKPEPIVTEIPPISRPLSKPSDDVSRPRTLPNWDSRELLALSQHTIGLYPMPGTKAQQKAAKIQEILQTVGFKGVIRIYREEQDFFEKVNYDEFWDTEIRYDRGLESIESSTLKKILDQEFPELEVELRAVNQGREPTVNFISIFLNNQ